MKPKRHIYTLTDPRDGSVRYVGCTINPEARAYAWRMRATSKPGQKWLDALRSAGLFPELKVVEICDFKDGPERELHWIKKMSRAGCDLLNRAGVEYRYSGYIFSRR